MSTILLIGCPNSGKTALFNMLSGANRKVANYSGITVDTATSKLKSTEDINIVDLPGIYSLTPSSIDEAVTISTLIGENPKLREFDEVISVVDLTRIESSLSLTLALKELFNGRISVIFNKSDVDSATDIDFDKLGKTLGLPYIVTTTISGEDKAVGEFILKNINPKSVKSVNKLALPKEATVYNPFNIDFNSNQLVDIDHNEIDIHSKIEDYQRKARDLKELCSFNSEKTYIRTTSKIDNFALHPLFGGAIFMVIFYVIFHSIYTFSGPLMDLIDQGVSSFGELIAAQLSEGMLNSFLVDGVIAGVGGVIIFLPQIMILFFLLSLLEQSGYIARASIITDKIMNIFGLNGKAFLPYMSGFACSVPAIMATRTIADKKERLATLMTIPLITCSARLPVYVLLIGTFIPNKTVLGIFNSQALAFFFLYFLGSITALIMAKLFRLTLYKGKSTSFIIELPLYNRPSLKIAWKSSCIKGRVFLKKAGTIILGLSMLIWVLSTFPKVGQDQTIGKSDAQVAAISLEHSAMGRLGKAIEPIIQPLGYNWKIGVGVLVAFGARELFVSTLGTIYALGDVDEESSTLRERIQNEIDPVTKKPIFNLAVAWSLLIFFAYAAQCISTLAIVKRETESWYHVIGMTAYMTALAYGGAFITYRILI